MKLKAKKYQQGGATGTNFFRTDKKAYVDSVLNANKGLEWVQRLYDRSAPDTLIPGNKYPSTHLMSSDGAGYAFPMLQRNSGKWNYFKTDDAAVDYSKAHNTGIQFPSEEQANWFATSPDTTSGYKMGTNVITGHDSGGKVNKTGYLKNSKTKDNPFNIIPSGNITTKGMAFPIFANGKLLFPDTGDYKFNTDHVLETPALNKGGAMKKYKLKTKKMQAGGVAAGAAGAIDPLTMLPQMIQKTEGQLVAGATLGADLLSPHQTFGGTDAPTLGVSDALLGIKAGSKFGGPLGAVVGGGLGLAKDVMDFNQDKKDWTKNLQVARGAEKVNYDATHKPYGTRGYMQGTPNESVYSLYDGGNIPMKRNIQTVITDQTSHGSVSLSKQEGGEIPNDLNELFDRAMKESGGDEEKAGKLVEQYQEHPEMMQNKKKPHLKKKKAA